MVVIAGFMSGLAKLIGEKNTVEAVTYVQTNLGGVVAACFGLVALGTAAWGIYKTWKRGAQLSTVAASSEVPNHVAKISK
jgi:hypothetical protein